MSSCILNVIGWLDTYKNPIFVRLITAFKVIFFIKLIYLIIYFPEYKDTFIIMGKIYGFLIYSS